MPLRNSLCVFALNKTHKLFRNGKLYRLSETPLDETLVPASKMTLRDQKAKQSLQQVIADAMAGVDEPPLVDAFGDPVR